VGGASCPDYRVGQSFCLIYEKPLPQTIQKEKYRVYRMLTLKTAKITPAEALQKVSYKSLQSPCFIYSGPGIV